MRKFKCVCGKKFEDFESYTKHAKDCVAYQMKQNREARLKIENGLNLSS